MDAQGLRGCVQDRLLKDVFGACAGEFVKRPATATERAAPCDIQMPPSSSLLFYFYFYFLPLAMEDFLRRAPV